MKIQIAEPMRKIVVLIVLFLFSSGIAFASGEEKPDRSALVALMEQYLAALADHDPSAVPLASDVKLVENTEVTPIGKGLWE